MGLLDDLARGLYDLSTAYAQADGKVLANTWKDVVTVLNQLKPRSSNITRMVAILKKDNVDDELLLEMWTDWLEAFEELDDPVDLPLTEKDAWLEVFKAKMPKTLSAVVTQTVPNAAVSESGDASEGKSLKNLGITLRLPHYAGDMGKCASWWRQTTQILEGMNLAQNEYFVVVLDLLDGDALDEFWQRLEGLVESGDVSLPYSFEDVAKVIASMIELFDAGQHTSLLLRHRALSQVKGETTVKFRARFMRVINSLRVYGYNYTQDQLVHDFGSRLRNWKAIAAHKPESLDDILNAVASLRADDSNIPAPSSGDTLLAINNADARGDEKSLSSILHLGNSGKRTTRTGKTIKCFNCDGSHHIRDCPEPRVVKCFKCGSPDHLRNSCPKLRVSPSGNSLNQE